MFITAICFLFQIKPQWPKKKCIYVYWNLFSSEEYCARRAGGVWPMFGYGSVAEGLNSWLCLEIYLIETLYNPIW